jgi:glycosyltransferase involved in cell wall biosynthesis
MRVLYLVHGHEEFSAGGAEVAAFSLFRSMQFLLGSDACWMLAAYPETNPSLPFGHLQSVYSREREYVIGTRCEYSYLNNRHILALKDAVERLINISRPTIIHIHHFMHFGIDIIPLLQRLSPHSRIVVTLHEYLALCLNNGQMVTTKDHSLCEKPDPLACVRCFPEFQSNNVFLRLQYVTSILNSVDALISPSLFLRDRYKSCGVSQTRFECIENGIHLSKTLRKTEEKGDENHNKLDRFAYFGQLNEYKGILTLLRAVLFLKRTHGIVITLMINGANLKIQPESFQDEFRQLLAEAGASVQMLGMYKRHELASRMQSADWTIVPSLWWENSPVVIQESFYFKKPVIGSNIGGIMEKIKGKGGLLFEVGNPISLAEQIEFCAGNQTLHAELQAQIPTPFMDIDCAHSHHDLYKEILSRP